MENVLVTGAGGLVGSHLVPMLAEKCRVHAVTRSGEGPAGENVTPIAMDLARPFDRAALPKRIDAVVWLAQSSRFREFPEGAADMVQVNLAQLHAGLEYAREADARAFVYASTGSVYDPSPEPLTEESPLGKPGRLGFYAASRLAAELLAGCYSSLFAVPVLRFFFVYGRGQKPDMLIPRLVGNVRDGQRVRLQGRDGLRLNPIHSGDAASAVIAALELGRSETINVAGAEPSSIRSICETAGELLGREPQFETDEAAEAPAILADISRMEELLGAPRVPLREGLADLA